MNTVDLSGLRVIASRDVEAAAAAGATELVARAGGVVTPSARDLLQKLSIQIRFNNVHCDRAPRGAGAVDPLEPAVEARAHPQPVAGPQAAKPARSEIERLFRSPDAQAAKEEICAVGHKLWRRSYVDGNGGNISYRLAENAVLCTPTLLSKADLTPDDICMVDLQGNQLAGRRSRTS